MTRSKDDGGFAPSGFGKMLQTLRAAAGLSQSELAAKVGAHRQTVSKLERGVIEPGWPLVLLIAKALGVRPNDFDPAPRKRNPR